MMRWFLLLLLLGLRLTVHAAEPGSPPAVRFDPVLRDIEGDFESGLGDEDRAGPVLNEAGLDHDEAVTFVRADRDGAFGSLSIHQEASR